MKHNISLKYNLTQEEHENFVCLVRFLQRKGFPIDFKSILQAGLNQLMSNYFKEEWGQKKAKVTRKG